MLHAMAQFIHHETRQACRKGQWNASPASDELIPIGNVATTMVGRVVATDPNRTCKSLGPDDDHSESVSTRPLSKATGTDIAHAEQNDVLHILQRDTPPTFQEYYRLA